MWQVAVTAAAAVAGSSLIAKHLFSPNTTQTHPFHDPAQDQDHNIAQVPTISPPHSPNPPSLPPVSGHECDTEKGGVFWFSSSGSSGKSSGHRYKLKKKGGSGKNNKNGVGFENSSVDQRKSCGKKVLVCLKKRRTCRNLGVKRDSSCSSKDSPSFGLGLGLGIVYMMSAGKAEISKLSTTVDETAKVVHELKSELNKKSFAPYQQVHVFDTGESQDSMQMPMTKQANAGPCKLNNQPSDMKLIKNLADSDYASSVLTEEQQPEGAEMNQLEAELESELQKLPWSTSESFDHTRSDGVSPEELNDKLSHLLVKQQESHILELESELNLAHSKLQEKEAELRALKDCVRRLTEFSLSNLSDEEKESCGEKEHGGECEESIDNVIVGKKRPMRF